MHKRHGTIPRALCIHDQKTIQGDERLNGIKEGIWLMDESDEDCMHDTECCVWKEDCEKTGLSLEDCLNDYVFHKGYIHWRTITVEKVFDLPGGMVGIVRKMTNNGCPHPYD